jgi:hypothetical protein
VQCFPDYVLSAPEILQDSPINLASPYQLKDPKILPQMRFLHHDKEILELTFVLLLNGAAN